MRSVVAVAGFCYTRGVSRGVVEISLSLTQFYHKYINIIYIYIYTHIPYTHTRLIDDCSILYGG